MVGNFSDSTKDFLYGCLLTCILVYDILRSSPDGSELRLLILYSFLFHGRYVYGNLWSRSSGR